jgi:hypothetical protein
VDRICRHEQEICAVENIAADRDCCRRIEKTGVRRRTPAERKRNTEPSMVDNVTDGRGRMPNFALSVLRGGNSIHLQCNRSLCEQPAVDRCARFHCDQRLGQDNSFKVRSCSEGHFTGDLPEYVLGLCVSAQDDSLAAAYNEIF